jgi:hypothetical protein
VISYVITSFITRFSSIPVCAVVTEFSLWSVLHTSLCEDVSSYVAPVGGSVRAQNRMQTVNILVVQLIRGTVSVKVTGEHR